MTARPVVRLPVVKMPDGRHGDVVAVALGCQCKACRRYATQDLLLNGGDEC